MEPNKAVIHRTIWISRQRLTKLALIRPKGDHQHHPCRSAGVGIGSVQRIWIVDKAVSGVHPRLASIQGTSDTVVKSFRINRLIPRRVKMWAWINECHAILPLSCRLQCNEYGVKICALAVLLYNLLVVWRSHLFLLELSVEELWRTQSEPVLTRTTTNLLESKLPQVESKLPKLN